MPKSKPRPSKTRKRTANSLAVKRLLQHQRLARERRDATAFNSMDMNGVSASTHEKSEEENMECFEMNIPCEELPPIETEPDSNPPLTLSDVIQGRRIVNLPHVLRQYEQVVLHPTKCTMGRLRIVGETRSGLCSSLNFYCDNCEKRVVITTQPLDENKNINMEIAWGSMSIGIGHNQTEELLGLIDVPFMTSRTYAKQVSRVKKVWQEHLWKQMQLAGEEEKKIAIQKEQFVTIDNIKIPFTTVIVDGGWCKRSYGHNYNSPSGVAIIIGAETKKILHIGIRNKVCSMCLFYKRANEAIKPHECALNFSGASSSMEQDIIVEGFSNSIRQHGLVYKRFVGDGDSSVYARIIERVPYGRQVIKIECANHMTRCINDKLHKLASNTKFPLHARKLLNQKVDGISTIERIVKGIRTAIKNVEKNNEPAIQLQKDILNAPCHVFGSHTNCRGTFCTKHLESTSENIKILKDHGIWTEIYKILDPMIQKHDRLAFNKTTNQAERYMALVAKCIGGKRVDFARRDSYTARTYAAALSHGAGPDWHFGPWKKATRREPSVIMRKLFTRRKRHLLRKSSCRQQRIRPKKRSSTALNVDYGPNAAQPDIDPNDMQRKCEQYLNDLCEQVATPGYIAELEKSTRGQHLKQTWRDARRNRLTASNFGAICKMQDSTLCGSTVHRLVYGKDLSGKKSIAFGRINEEVAKTIYKEKYDIEIKSCGLFIDKQYPFLGASPDGLIGERGLAEIKCLDVVGEHLLKNVPESVNKNSLCYTIRNGEICLKRNHNYWYQVQGQLHITGRDYCDFIIYSRKDFAVERILKDENFWHINVPKLVNFYKTCILPEIIDPRVRRDMEIRDPEDRINAHIDRYPKQNKMCPRKNKCHVCKSYKASIAKGV